VSGGQSAAQSWLMISPRRWYALGLARRYWRQAPALFIQDKLIWRVTQTTKDFGPQLAYQSFDFDDVDGDGFGGKAPILRRDGLIAYITARFCTARRHFGDRKGSRIFERAMRNQGWTRADASAIGGLAVARTRECPRGAVGCCRRQRFGRRRVLADCRAGFWRWVLDVSGSVDCTRVSLAIGCVAGALDDLWCARHPVGTRAPCPAGSMTWEAAADQRRDRTLGVDHG